MKENLKTIKEKFQIFGEMKLLAVEERRFYS